MIRVHRFATSLGPVYATATDEGLTGLYFAGGRHAPPIAAAWRPCGGDAVLRACQAQLGEYLEGKRTAFALPLAPQGSAFQRAVWARIAAIGYGQTVTYAAIAQQLGVPLAARAVGAATGRNPLSIIVPCHRVVGRDGALTGYAGGIDRKQRLLALERALAVAT